MNNVHQYNTPKGPSQFNQLCLFLQKFLPYWPLFFISVDLCLAVAYIKLRAETPIYVAYAKVILKDKGKGTESKVLDEFNLAGQTKDVENEILVLRSSGLMNEVVRRLNLSVSVFNEGRVRIEELYKGNSPVQFIPVRKDSIFGAGSYYFKVDWAKGEVEIDNRKVAFNTVIKIGNTDYNVVPNMNYNKSVVGKNYFASFNSVGGASGGLIGSIGANPISATSTVIDVKMSTPVPEKGMDVLTELFEVYNEYTIAEKNLTAQNTLAFIDDRLATVAGDLDSIGTNVVQFEQIQSPIDIGSMSSNLFSQATQFENQKNQIDVQLRSLATLRSYMNNEGSVPSLGMVSDPGLGSLISQLQTSESRLREFSATDGPNSERVVTLKAEIKTIRNNIKESIGNVEKQYLTTRSSFSGFQGAKTSQLSMSPAKRKAFNTITRNQGIKETIYSYLLEKKEQTSLAAAATVADLRVLETASAYGPVSPIPKSFYTKWLMIGLLIPAGFVFLKDQLNRRVQLRSEIESKTNVPIVAEISQVNSDSPIVIREGKRTAVAEQFRALRTNLTFMGLAEKSNTIMVTSSSSGEGKSFAAINLAISFTLIGKKVALLELDLRKPKVSKLLQLRNDVGISNYLVNQATITEIIKPTEIKDLFVLPSGVIPPNPAELIQKDTFRQLMAEVKERFDFVIIDTAPVGPVADSFLLKEYVDATVYMVRQNKTHKIHLKMLDDLNRKNKFKNLCLVFNGLKKRGFTYGTYGYGYSGDNGDGYYVSEEKEGKVRLFGNRLKRTLGIKS